MRSIGGESGRLVDGVHERVVQMIVRGDLAPNARLHQERLAEKLGVSRTPIREALLRLEREGLVYTQPRRGMFVRAVTSGQVSELYEIREVLEPVAARLACERATPKNVAAIEAIQSRHERKYPRESSAAFRTNLELHLGLVQPCGNQLMLRFLRTVWHQDAAFRIFSFYTEVSDLVPRMVGEHREIVDAFAAGDAESVEDLLRVHIRSAFKALLGRLEQEQARIG